MMSRTKAKRVKLIELVGKKVLNEKGFLRLWKVKLRNRYADGSFSREYRCDMVHRRGTDCVAIIPYFFDKKGNLNIYMNRGIRPAIYFRKILHTTVPDRIENLYNYEAMAGSLEEDEKGEKAILERSREEILEELGFRVKSSQFERLGAGFYPSHGQSSEKIYLLALRVRPEERTEASGDGSVNEGDSLTVVLEAKKILRMCERGMIEDPKIEIGVSRLCKKLQYRIE